MKMRVHPLPNGHGSDVPKAIFCAHQNRDH